MGSLFKMCKGLCQSIDTLQWQLEAYDNELWSVLNEWEACAKSLKQLENALVDVPSTHEEKEVVAKDRKWNRPSAEYCELAVVRRRMRKRRKARRKRTQRRKMNLWVHLECQQK